MQKLDKQAQLDQIKADILKQNICPDLAQIATQLVIGDGNPNADIVIIGEAPGKKEDEVGRSFVGASGNVLDSLLASISLQRSEVYITNIVKYRPPNNRDPSKAEKQAFLPFLYQQLEIIEPKLVITLGRHAMNTFLPKAVIGDMHGTPVQPDDLHDIQCVLLPLYHPAAAMYNGSLKTTLQDDFLKIPKLLQTL